MNCNYLDKQQGTTMLLTMVFLLGLVAAIALATDTGHLLVNKTRLQNALDAAALSAAVALNGDPNRDTNVATAAGIATFNGFVGTSGNSELANLNGGSLNFQFSRTLDPWAPVTALNSAAFVRVTTNALSVNPILAQVLPAFSNTTFNVGATSTAGAVGQNCNLVPLVICPTNDADGAPQVGCNSAGCNGIPFNQRVCLKGGTQAAKSETCQDTSLPTGNFGLLRFDGMAGGNDIRQLFNGNTSVCTANAGWENGNKVGPVTQGISDRFNKDKVHDEYFPPVDGDGNQLPGPTDLHDNYDDKTVNGPWDNDDGTERYREVEVPVASSCDGAALNIIASTCFFLTQKPEKHGGSNEVYGELIEKCKKPGQFSPVNSNLFGPYDVVLFKSPGSGDS